MARLIQDSINTSKKVGSLSPKALSLYTLLIPKYNSYGKMNGDPYFIKGEVCRNVSWLDLKTIKTCLKEINEQTNVKWWADQDGNYWLHALNFDEHQPGLRKDRRGKDLLPSFPGVSGPLLESSGSSTGLLRTEEEGELEEELEGEYKTPHTPQRRDRSEKGLQVQEIYSYWQEQRKHPNSKLDKTREKAILARIDEKYSVDRIKAAIRGIQYSPHHMGQNDRNTVYDDIELICRNGKNVDKFADLDEKARARASPPRPKILEETREELTEEQILFNKQKLQELSAKIGLR